MTLLHEAVSAKKFDVRVVERNVARGFIRAEDADKAAKDLPDDSENAEWVNLEVLAQEETEGSNGLGSTHH
jgi:hypothetical protein